MATAMAIQFGLGVRSDAPPTPDDATPPDAPPTACAGTADFTSEVDGVDYRLCVWPKCAGSTPGLATFGKCVRRPGAAFSYTDTAC